MKFIRTLAVATMLAVASSPALAGEDESPLEVAGSTTVNAEQAFEKYEAGVVFVDVRKPSDFEAGRIPDAAHLDVKTDFTEEALAEEVAKDDEVVIYCNGASCKRSAAAAELAVGWGYKKVFYFRDGFPSWRAAGHPVE